MTDNRYIAKSIEAKWQASWEEARRFKTEEDSSKPKYYVLEMFPYPSGEIHMGHARNYVIGDVLARYLMMKGYTVLHPMGWDAFGLPAENAAIERGIHPNTWTQENISAMRRQLKALGLSYDWDREVATCDPTYYRWNQWIFLKMYEMGLAYKRLSTVNWCEGCKTVLANEQVEAGICWRCDSEVTFRELDQWFFKITDYAEELLEGLEDIRDGWPERVLTMQRNWIGKSYGAEIDFPLLEACNGTEAIRVYTTRQDTVYGATFMVLAPEHPLSRQIVAGSDREREALEFIAECAKEDRILRVAETGEKRGLFTGRYAINPMTKEKIPIWIASFVLMDYGTGAIMAVPAHDQRDLEFARQNDIHVRVVINPTEGGLDEATMTEAYVHEGVLVNCGPFSGMDSPQAREAIADHFEEAGIGRKAINYRLRDWGISRQRYWGTPIPIIYCDACGTVPVPEEDLPVILPLDLESALTGISPLNNLETFLNVACPSCGEAARRETDTMDTFVDSSWYFLRYTSPQFSDGPFDHEAARYWMSVDQYIGGIEHAVLHLLYARFYTRVLRDLGLIDTDEPFARLLSQGMVTKDGAVMSKSRGNTVSPDEIVTRYGADTCRLFILFTSPPEKELEWNDAGVAGAHRFLLRVWRFVTEHAEAVSSVEVEDERLVDLPEPLDALRRATHRTIRKVTDDIQGRFRFNTAIASMMELVNTCYKTTFDLTDERSLMVLKETVTSLVLLFTPFAPHAMSELWERLGQGDVAQAAWPSFDAALVRAEEVLIVVQVNGKLRSRINLPAGTPSEEIEAAALADTKVQPWIAGKKLKKVVVVPDRLANIVVG
ncbi:MAG: leucine--tRNA ligase [bacterium]|nr:leucine--tRNA ligase [bacterium]